MEKESEVTEPDSWEVSAQAMSVHDFLQRKSEQLKPITLEIW